MRLDKSDRLIVRIHGYQQQIRVADLSNARANCLDLVRITKLARERRHYFGIPLCHSSNS